MPLTALALVDGSTALTLIDDSTALALIDTSGPTGGLPMPTSIRNHVDQITRVISGAGRGIVNRLASAIDTTTTTITFAAEPIGVTAGSWLCIDAELIYVETMSGLSATVKRAMLDSAADSHDAGTQVEINWRFFTIDVMDALREEIQSWDEEIYQVVVADPVTVGTVRSFEANWPTYRHLLEANVVETASASATAPKDWFDHVRVYPDIGTTKPTIDVGPSCPTGTMYFVYAGDFDTEPFTLSTTLAAMGITTTLSDVCRYGAMARLLDGTAGTRMDRTSQPDPRIGEDVGPLDEARLAASYWNFRNTRLGEERNRLRHRYGPRW